MDAKADKREADPYNLERFVEAQASVIDKVLSELRSGYKQSHWMWFIFPQIRGLGRSPVSVEYAISGREEARAYSQHPILGPRLKECTRMVVLVENRSAREIFGSPDDMKFRSSMTLFSQVSEDNIFTRALEKYFQGLPDQMTLDRL